MKWITKRPSVPLSWDGGHFSGDVVVEGNIAAKYQDVSAAM